ncbi:hypothetical protein VTK73DRAFT_6373 [Phialemonium thermophilum]|uniref:Uncharacterized protein n=1 Tax=Phialemonium thermophilum TaxID=223376 RepID=A0ABR3XVF0_9PEZI
MFVPLLAPTLIQSEAWGPTHALDFIASFLWARKTPAFSGLLRWDADRWQCTIWHSLVEQRTQQGPGKLELGLSELNGVPTGVAQRTSLFANTERSSWQPLTIRFVSRASGFME